MIGNLRYDEQMEIAEMLYEAERTAKPIGKITDRYPEMNVHDAYKVDSVSYVPNSVNWNANVINDLCDKNRANHVGDGIKEYFINLIKGKIHFDEFWALRNISFQVKKGESLALIGRNGSGKSTILKTIAGIIRPARGTVRVSGNIAPLIEMTGGFDRSLSARENIYLVGTMHGHTKKYIRSRFDEIVEFAEIEKFIDVPLKNYSSGMVSRLGFAIATSVDADIIIADEVLSVGDARFRMKCEKRIDQMLNGGTTLLFVSHNSAQVKKLCKRAVWLEKGKVMDIGPSADVCDKYAKFIRSMPGKPVKKPAPKPVVEDHTEDDDILS